MTLEELKEVFLEGVSVVGNAESIFQKKPIGNEIDSRPTVRFNWITLNSEYTGSRKDCICTNVPNKVKDTEYQILIGTTYDTRFDHFNYPKILLEPLLQKLGKKPSNGIRILYLLDYMKIKDVHVYGFDWKKTGSLSERKGEKTRPENESHDYKKEKDLSLELIERNNWKLY